MKAGMTDVDEVTAVREAVRRNEELSAGITVGRPHEEVIQAANRAIACE
jgi:hypothetical protein